MKLTMVKIVIVMALILGVAGIAMSENSPGAFTVSPFIGGHLFEGDQNLEHGYTAGVGIGYNFDKTWGIEGVINYIKTETLKNDNNVDGLLYRIDGLYHFNSYGKLLPYVAAGIGGISLNPERGGSDSDLLMNYGAGVKYFINDFTMLRGDVRHIVSFDDTHHNLAYTFGVTFLFGGEKEKKIVKRPPQPVDSDGDGVHDDIDKCPDTPAGVKVDSLGCPLDTDGDGVYDYLDKCPETPKDMRVDLHGCPLDSDGDGVYDSMDQCPGTPKGASVDSYGCWVIEGTLFDSAKWNIKPSVHEILDEIVTVCKQNPSLRIEIQGHTDSRGSEHFNKKLSENRAKAVMKYLVEKGVEQDRLSAKGFGFSRPTVPNDTPEGRAQNRRVELMPIHN